MRTSCEEDADMVAGEVLLTELEDEAVAVEVAEVVDVFSVDVPAA
jgi:hypothetical protein